MSINQTEPAVRRAASALLERHRDGAASVAEREIDSRLARDDVQGALDMDQVRREVIFMLRDD